MLDFLVNYGYYGLFVACFLASTVLPFSSEVVFASVVALGLNPVTCIIVASIGNWLGGMTSYYLGFLGKVEWIEKYFRVKRDKIEKTQLYLGTKGAYFAFFSFVPFVGDLIPIALGMMRANMPKVALYMLAGKLFRYVAVMYLVKSIWS